MAKAMKEISCGAQKWEGEKRYSESSDKHMYRNFFFARMLNQLVHVGVAPGGSQVYQVVSLRFNLPIFLEASVKRHFYYSTKNCTSPDDLRRSLLKIVDHYQVRHCQLNDEV